MFKQSAQLSTLTQVNIHDFLSSFGLENLRYGRKALEALCWLPARRFAQQMANFDRQVREVGLMSASRHTLEGYARPVDIRGQEHIPASGPLLVLSNHPGMSDTLVLFTSLPRPDLRIIAAERPFLQSLSAVSQHLIYVSEDPNQRMGVVRAGVSHLRQGGALLTFPAGEIEPDPASQPGAISSLESWSDSITIFARMIPELTIITAIVSGVLWPAAMTHPLTRLRKAQPDRERLGAALQVLVQMLLPAYKPVTPRVTYGAPIRLAELTTQGNSETLMQAITQQARQSIRSLGSAPTPAERQSLAEAFTS
ncbi:MAG: 1-acyl-sn-glycerol-3-phosphate acyltransferase [Anaerolineales bacterium]|nr:MAG: 1-acyl-sn-glycerol-3-phosphate acyltransferase [Anaerolineales bacterium]